MVLFDRSWYNRAGVERVMGFCSDGDYWEFLRACPNFERMLIRSGIIILKYWFSVSEEEQERRFQSRLKDPTKRWKLSSMDLKSRELWVEYSKAKDDMFSYTDTKISPRYVVNADDKKTGQAQCHQPSVKCNPLQGFNPSPHRTSAPYVRQRLCKATYPGANFCGGYF